MRLGQKHRSSSKLLIAVLLLAAFIVLTNPTELPLVLLPVPFLLVYYISYIIFRWLVHKVKRISSGKSKFIALVLAVFPTLTLLLSSLNQLSIVDMAVVGLLVIGGLFYLRYADFLE